MTENQHWLSSRRWLKILLLVSLPLIAYANSLNNELFLDDLDYVVNNVYIRDWRYIPKMFTENMIAGAGKVSDYYRPAILLINTFAYSLWELNPMGYHLLSIIFHISNVVLIYFFLLMLLGQWQIPLLTALIFAVHPVHTESVASTSAGILWGMFFMLLTLIGHYKIVTSNQSLVTSSQFTKSSRIPRTVTHEYSSSVVEKSTESADKLGNYICGVILSRVWVLKGVTYFSLIIALLSKETMVVIPGYIFLLEFFFLCPKGSSRPLVAPSPSSGEEVLKEISLRFLRCLVRSLPYLIIVAVYITLRFTVLNFGGTGNLYRGHQNIFTENWIVRFHTFMVVLVEFFKIIFWPQHLYMERGSVIPIYVSFLNWPVILGFVIFVGMLFMMLFCTVVFLSSPKSEESQNKLMQIVPFGILWFLFGLVPVSNILIPVSTTMVEGWLYIPILGIILIFSCMVLSLGRMAKILRTGVIGFLILVVFACMVRTVQQNRVWKNPIAFYEHTLHYAPNSARFRNNLAMAYADKKRFDKAIEQYRLAIQISDEYPETHHNLANSYMEIGQVQDAEREFTKAIQMNPQFYHSYISLASLYFNYKRLDLAQIVLENLISKVPSRWEGYYNLGIVYVAKGEKGKAISVWQKGLNVDPYNRILREAIQKYY